MSLDWYARTPLNGPLPNTPKQGGVFLLNDLSAAQPTAEFDSDEFNTKEINGVDSDASLLRL